MTPLEQMDKLKKQILGMPPGVLVIKTTLEAHINLEATSPESLFVGSASPQECRLPLPRDDEGQLQAYPIAIAFSFGNQSLKKALFEALMSLPAHSAVEFISKPLGRLFPLDAFYSLFLATDKNMREQLVTWLDTLPEANLITLFTRSQNRLGLGSLNPALNILIKSEPEIALKIILIFQKISNQGIMALFKTQTIPTSRHEGLVQLFAAGIADENTALGLLDLISTLSPTQLERVFSGPNNYNGVKEDRDNLMRHLGSFSIKVHTKALELLSRLPTPKIEALLLSGQGDCYNPSTAMNAAFSMQHADTAGDKAAAAFIEVLHHRGSLKTLLYKPSNDEEYSFLHKVVKHRYKEALILYLEHTNLPWDIPSVSGETPYQLAVTNQNTAMMSLFETQPMRQALSNKERQDWNRLLPKNLKALNALWTQQRSLVHLAVIHENPAALEVLLKNGASPNSLDTQGLSPLDYALTLKDTACLRFLLEYPRLDLAQRDAAPTCPLTAIFKTRDHSLIIQALQHVEMIPGPKACDSLAQAFNHLPPQRADALESIFSMKNIPIPNVGEVKQEAEAFESSFDSIVHNYAKASQDSLSLFMFNVGRYLSVQANHSELFKTAKKFVLDRLRALSQSASDLDKKSIRKQLMLLLFSMHPKELLDFSKRLNLTNNSKIALEFDLVVCQGLIQPLFFSKLSYEDQLIVEQCLFNPEMALKGIANTHFQHTDLSGLPPQLLLHYAELMDAASLLNLCQHRLDAALIVLALEKELSQRPKNSSNLQELYSKLQEALQLLHANTSEAAVREFALALNLMRSETIKHSMRPILSNLWNQPLQNLRQLFICFHKEYAVVKDSLMADFLAEEEEGLTQHQHARLLIIELQNFCLEPELDSQALKSLLHALKEKQIEQLLHLCGQAKISCLTSFLQTTLQCHRSAAALIAYPVVDKKLMQEGLDGLSLHHSQLFSLAVLHKGLYYTGCDIWSRLSQMNDFINKEPGLLTLQAAELLFTAYVPLLRSASKRQNQDLLQTLALIMERSSPLLQMQIIEGMQTKDIELLLDCALTGLHSDNLAKAQDCKTLLTCCSQINLCTNEDKVRLIKTYLNSKDLGILGDSNLETLAEKILSTADTNLLDATINGIWIGRLLLSVEFMAQCPPRTIARLVERLRLIIRSLSLHAFMEIDALLQGRLHSQSHNQGMALWEEEALKNPKRRAYFEERRLQRLNLRADDSIRAHLNYLEDNCLAMEATNPSLATAAKGNLYAYYNQQLSNPRTDTLFKITQFIHSKTALPLGDVALAQSTIQLWIDKNLDHLNFTQLECYRKQKTILYNAKHQRIGWINEANYAMTDGNELLIQRANMYAGMPLYDDNKLLLGHLKHQGDVAHCNLLQEQTSARLLASVPQKALAPSGLALKSLIYDVLKSNSLATLYKAELPPSKKVWLAEQVIQGIVDCQEKLSPRLFEDLVLYHPLKSVFRLLKRIQHSANAQSLFEALVADETAREALFERPDLLNTLMQEACPKEVLANYLLHYKKPWFSDGLELLALAIPPSLMPEVLNKALEILNTKYNQGILAKEIFQDLLSTLISQEASAKVLLELFLQDKQGYIQECLHAEITNFSTHFGKKLLMPCIRDLNQNSSNWQNSARYRLVLFILKSNHKKIFIEEELRYSRDKAWSSEELRQITDFLMTHLKTGHNPDKNLGIFQLILGQLIFRLAHYGLPDIFYDNSGNFNVHLAKMTLHSSKLNKYLALMYLPQELAQPLEELTKSLEEMYENLRCFFDKGYAQRQLTLDFLKKNQGIMDWGKVMADSFRLNQSEHLPVFIAFLLNYAGNAAHLRRVISDFLQDSELLKQREQHLHQVTHLLVQVPDREVSLVIFSKLCDSIEANPDILDTTVFRHMLSFHNQHTKNSDYILAGLELIRYLGEQGYYQATIACCKLLESHLTQENEYRAKLQQIQKEAQVEGYLSTFLAEWYFAIVRFFMRIINYFRKEPSEYVRFCDTNTPKNPIETPKKIKAFLWNEEGKEPQEILNGQEVEKNLAFMEFIKPYKEKYRTRAKVSTVSVFEAKTAVQETNTVFNASII